MNKLYLFLLVIVTLFCYNNSNAQEVIINTDKPTFPGGEYALAKFISDNIILPESAMKGSKCFVTVIVQVDVTGSLVNPKILKTYNSEYNDEAFRIISAMPKWNTAIKKGKPIKSNVIIKIPFYKHIDYDFQYKKAVEYFQTKKYTLAYLSINEAIRKFPLNIEYKRFKDSLCSIMKANNKTCEDIENEISKIDIEASFPGGESELIMYIAQNTRYPAYERENGIDGKVILTYIIDESGNVIDVDYIKSVSYYMDKESMRVISSMPKFSPAIKNGVPVPKRYTTPVVYKIFQ